MVEGILPLWKEKGITSFGCVREVRHILKIKKVGHAGTLDPEVEGVLPIAIGGATKVLEFMLEGDKAYSGEVVLGFSTATEDATGEIIERLEIIEDILEEKVDEVLESFLGTITQTPPMYSAVKINGKKLYEYAFAGEVIERPSREVIIHELTRTSEVTLDPIEKTAKFSFDVSCSKGTYIRTLAVDIGRTLGVPAHMSKLTRIKSGPIDAEQTITLEKVREAVEAGNLQDYLLPIDYGLTKFSKIDISESLWEKVKNGALIQEKEFDTNVYPVLLTHQDQIVSLYDKHPSKNGLLKPRKMFKTEL